MSVSNAEKLQRLTRDELRKVCSGLVQYVSLSRKQELIDLLLSSPTAGPLQAALRIADAKNARTPKRKYIQHAEPVDVPDAVAHRAKRLRPDDFLHQEYPTDLGEFLTLPTEAEYDDCIRRYLQRTSNAALAPAVCMVCARRVFKKDCETRSVRNIPNSHLLQPVNPHQDWVLTNGLGLHRSALTQEQTGDDESGPICPECLHTLQRGKQVPLFSLANNMWIGDIPFELSILNRPEQLLLSLAFPVAYTYHLRPMSNRFDPQALQTGYRGNVSTYRMDTKEIARFMSPTTLPHPPELLASTIAVTFVGPGKRPERTMRGLFRVSKHRVLQGFKCLKAINPLYADIELNEAALNDLPEDDVPDALMLNVRYEPEASEADNTGSYVPAVDPEEEEDEGGDVGDGGGESDSETSQYHVPSFLSHSDVLSPQCQE